MYLSFEFGDYTELPPEDKWTAHSVRNIKLERGEAMEISSFEELRVALLTNKIAIYGANYVAIRFYKALKEQHLDGNVSCFVTTKREKDIVEGLEVKAIDELKAELGIIMCIAVHESVKDEIIEILEEKGFRKFIWVFPFLYELILGTPIARNQKISLRNIWNANNNNYIMAVRYQAIDQYFGKNDYGYDVYKKCLSLFNSEKTSEKRLQQFIKLIQSWEKDGYDESRPSFLLEDYMYIDGTHRIALASYFKQEYVLCDIYPSTKSLNEIHGAGAILSKEIVEELGLDKEIITILEGTNRRIEEQYK